jgi:hypothetical protein
MSSISNIASPGHPTRVVAEQPVRAPLAGNVAWSTPTLSIPLGNVAQIASVPNACVDAAGGKLNRA